MLLNMVRLEDFAADFTPEKVDLLGLVRQLINDNRRMFITHRVFPRIVGDDGGEANWRESCERQQVAPLCAAAGAQQRDQVFVETESERQR